jgi:predicted transcriptional regulator of viral defense system
MPGQIWERAFDVAVDQHGFISFMDFRRLSENPAILRQWHQRGRVERVAHGIYRFPSIPVTSLDPYALAALWPSGRGILSHDTALELHDLCDINPSRIHLTLPLGYYPRRGGGEGYVIHHEKLQEQDITWHEGIRIVTPAVAIRQAWEGEVPLHLVKQAFEKAQRLGRVPPSFAAEFERRSKDDT